MDLLQYIRMTCKHIGQYAFGSPSACEICLRDRIVVLEEQVKKLLRDKADLMQKLGEEVGE